MDRYRLLSLSYFSFVRKESSFMRSYVVCVSLLSTSEPDTDCHEIYMNAVISVAHHHRTVLFPQLAKTARRGTRSCDTRNVSYCLISYLSNVTVSMSVCLYVRLSVRPPIHPSIHLSICLSIYLSIYLSLYSPCGPWLLFQFLNLYTVLGWGISPS
jgi:hypothetical protein